MPNILLDNFIVYALLVGCGVAIIAGILGCFVVWRRMAYFSDSLSHSALLGIALGLATGIHMNVSLLVIGFLFATLLVYLNQQRVFAMDTLLGLLAHTSLAAGVITISLIQKHSSVDIYSYFFGDILTVPKQSIYWIFAMLVVSFMLLIRHWSALVLTTLDEHLARSAGINPLLMQLLLMGLMTLVVAMAVRMVGILLITALLIIPSATARQLARSPEMMAVIASVLGVLAVIQGISASLLIDIPTGPAIVVCSAGMFFLVFFMNLIWRFNAAGIGRKEEDE